MVCPLMYGINIKDLDENIAGVISKFANDTKISVAVGSKEGCPKIRQNLDQLGQGITDRI